MKPEKYSHVEHPGIENSDAMLGRAASRAASHKFYLASAFAAYRSSEDLDEAMLADFLGCSPSTLKFLSLCRRPAVVSETEFRADLDQIASRFDVRRDRLVILLRAVEFLGALQTQKSPVQAYQTRKRSSLLLAAQDRLQEETEGYNSAEDYNFPETRNSAEADELAEEHEGDHLEEAP